MRTRHLAPALLVRNTGPAEPRKKARAVKIPGAGHHGVATVPDEVVAGLKWCVEQGFTHSQVSGLYPGISRSYYVQVRDDINRRDVLPRCPPFISEHFWKERYRFPRDPQP